MISTQTRGNSLLPAPRHDRRGGRREAGGGGAIGRLGTAASKAESGISVSPRCGYIGKEAVQSSRPAAREAGGRTGSGTQPRRSDGTGAALMMELTGYGGTMDVPDMRHEWRGKLQKKSPEIISGII